MRSFPFTQSKPHSSISLYALSFPASWKGPFTHAQPEQQTNRTSWRFVHGWRGISQRVISCWWTFGRLRAIASLKRRLSSDGIVNSFLRYRTYTAAAVSKPKVKQSKRIRHTARPMVFISVYRPDRKQQYSKRIARCRRTITRRTAA